MYAVVYSKTAARELKKLDVPTAGLVYGWIEKNLVECDNPRQHGKPLVGNKKGYWRYRVGAYRIIADIQDEVVKIEIVNVAHRRSVYDI